jgi:hypothetical protein
MSYWWVLVTLGLAAVAALAAAAWTDRRTRERRDAILNGPPATPVPGLGAAANPQYVLPDDAAKTPPEPLADDRRHALQDAVAKATVIEGGWARDRFVTDPVTRWAVVEGPVVLVTPAVRAFRELWPALAAARDRDAGLVVVATAFDAATLDTLVMNATSGTLACAAVRCPGEAALGVAAMATHARVVPTASLQAGFVTKEMLGTCVTWVSAGAQSWALGPQGS